MDLATIIGFVSGIALLVVSILMNGNLTAFVDVGSFMIVGGGTIAASFINFPLKEVLNVIAVVKNAFVGKLPTAQELIDKLAEFAEVARKDGILAMEKKLETVENSYMLQGLQLVIDGAREESVKQIMSSEMDNIEERHKAGVEVLTAMAGFAPAFGMIGTLIGLVQMLQSLEDPSQIGAGMAVALITTFYGSIFANLVFVPLAGKLKRRSKLELQICELIYMGVNAIQSGENPRMIKKTLISYVNPKDRPKE